MKKSLSFCSSCRIACLAVLSCLFSFLGCSGGEENPSDSDAIDGFFSDENSEEDDSTDTTPDTYDPAEEVETEVVSSCEEYEMMNNTLFNCCGNNVCVDVECKIESCKAFCSEMLKGLPLPSEDLEILSPTQFFVKPIFTTCTKK